MQHRIEHRRDGPVVVAKGLNLYGDRFIAQSLLDMLIFGWHTRSALEQNSHVAAIRQMRRLLANVHEPELEFDRRARLQRSEFTVIERIAEGPIERGASMTVVMVPGLCRPGSTRRSARRGTPRPG